MSKQRIAVGEFLEANPEFFFDVEEYLISTRYASLLRERMAQFTDLLEGRNARRATPDSLLREIKNGACRDVRAYRGYENYNDFRGLPFVTKNALRDNHELFRSAAYSAEQLWLKNTSGTTGPPIPITYSPEFYFQLFHLSPRKVAARAGIPDLGMRPFFCLSISDIPSVRNSVFIDPTDDVGMTLQVVVDATRTETVARVFELIRLTQPECVSTKPSLFELLVESDAACGGVGDRTPLFLISGGHLLDSALRDNISGKFRAPVVDVYGMTEFGVIASECRERQLHLDELSFCAEACEADDRMGGEADELLLSSLDNLAMPLLRYRTGDRARVSYEPCGCGVAGARFVDFFGRRIRCFVLSTGEKLSPTYFNDLFSRFPALNEFQIVQREYDGFELSVEFKPDADAREETLRAIAAHVAGALPATARVTSGECMFRGPQKFERYLTLVGTERAGR